VLEVLRIIQKPVAGSVTVFRTRSGVVTTATTVTDPTTGLVAVTGHIAGDTYTWTGEFDVPVTFTDDEWMSAMEVNTDNLHLDSSSIKLEEILL
jgi:hypothetical protein